MQHRHRTWHRRAWPLIAALAALGLIFALSLRAPAATIVSYGVESRR